MVLLKRGGKLYRRWKHKVLTGGMYHPYLVEEMEKAHAGKF